MFHMPMDTASCPYIELLEQHLFRGTRLQTKAVTAKIDTVVVCCETDTAALVHVHYNSGLVHGRRDLGHRWNMKLLAKRG